MNDSERLHACKAHQKILLGGFQRLSRRGVEQHEHRLRRLGRLGLAQQVGKAQTIDRRLIRHTQRTQGPPEFMHDARLERQRHRRTRSA
jgi:hypothetical protein